MSSEYDPYVLNPKQIKKPPITRWGTIKQLGPGLLLTGSIVGSGELIATTRLGAEVGFVVLWLILISCIVKVPVQSELGRHAIVTGQTTFVTFNLCKICEKICKLPQTMMQITQT